MAGESRRVHSHKLIAERQALKGEWLLEWDNAKFVLKDPGGQPVFEADAANAVRVIDLYELYVESKISLASPQGSLAFKKNPAAVAELRRFVDVRLAEDVDYRSELRRQSLLAIPLGLAMFLVAGGLFGLYCWYASWAPDPPLRHWIRWLGWLVHLVLAVLLGAAFAGAVIGCFGLRRWLGIRRIERAIATGNSCGQ